MPFHILQNKGYRINSIFLIFSNRAGGFLLPAYYCISVPIIFRPIKQPAADCHVCGGLLLIYNEN